MDGDEDPPEVVIEKIKSRIPFFETSKPTLYIASELSVSDKTLDALQRTFNLIQKEVIFPELKLFPFEVRALIDYEIALRSDLFLGYPCGNSFSQFLLLERRLMELSKTKINNQKKKFLNFTLDEEEFDEEAEEKLYETSKSEGHSPSSRRQALLEFSRRNVMLMTFTQFCTKQTTRTHWNGVPVFDDYESENQIRDKCIWGNEWVEE